MNPPTVHASAVLVGESGILIRGAPASGKSSLALGLIDGDPLRTRLIADDRVALVSANGRLVASAPSALEGLIEIRGQGLVRLPHVSPAVIRLVVDLLPLEFCERLPEENDLHVAVAGVVLPRLVLPENTPVGAGRVRIGLVHAQRKSF